MLMPAATLLCLPAATTPTATHFLKGNFNFLKISLKSYNNQAALRHSASFKQMIVTIDELRNVSKDPIVNI